VPYRSSKTFRNLSTIVTPQPRTMRLLGEQIMARFV